MKVRTPLTEYSDEEIVEEINRRRINNDALFIKSININGLTYKDIVIVYGADKNNFDFDTFKFAPHVKRGSELEFGYNAPEIENYTEWSVFFPKGFYECQECIYEFDGDLEPALEALKNAGLEVKRDDEWFDW